MDPMMAPVSPTEQALAATQNGKLVPRDRPEPAQARSQLVARLTNRVQRAKSHWKRDFDRMKNCAKFASGHQWPDQQPNDDRYVANIVLRHLKHRTASLYARNPRAICKRREQLLSTVWDGTYQSLVQAQQTLQTGQALAMDAQAMGAAMDPVMLGQMMVQMQEAQAVVADAEQVAQRMKLLDRIGKSVEIVYKYQLDEQSIPFKSGMKETVRRALTTGVGYIKLGFQRAMQMKPEIARQIEDYSERLATIERLSADIADGEKDQTSPEAEQLRLAMQALAAEPMVITREGLDLTYPDSTAIIPDTKTKRLRHWVNAGWVAEEFMLCRDEIMDIFGVDVSSAASARSYQKVDGPANVYRQTEPWADDPDDGYYCVWEIYSRKDGLVYTICEGYPDFLREPKSPDVWLERFYPWFALTFNEVYCENSVFPPSDVELIKDMQLEMNRARQGLREHRRANRPKIAVPAGLLDDEDKDKLKTHPVNAILELNGLQPGQSVDQVLQPVKMPPIDPGLYNVNETFEDVLRVVGVQEANLGGTAGASATESSIAESSRMTGQSSDIDDLDETLNELARAAGQVLLLNLTPETVKEIAGPGAVWPQLDRATVAKEVFLEIEAASTGRPNKAAELQNMTQLMPLVFQLPGLSPEWVAKQVLTRLDDKLDLTEAFAAGLPSIQAMNQAKQMTPAAGDPGQDPNQQGEQGAQNSRTEPKRSNAGPQTPEPMQQAA